MCLDSLLSDRSPSCRPHHSPRCRCAMSCAHLRPTRRSGLDRAQVPCHSGADSGLRARPGAAQEPRSVSPEAPASEPRRSCWLPASGARPAAAACPGLQAAAAECSPSSTPPPRSAHPGRRPVAPDCLPGDSGVRLAPRIRPARSLRGRGLPAPAGPAHGSLAGAPRRSRSPASVRRQWSESCVPGPSLGCLGEQQALGPSVARRRPGRGNASRSLRPAGSSSGGAGRQPVTE
ncbi:hypothetical protein HNR02_003405 [Amycolatopsis endophytica]|uniref:Uncharacterized protein n=1 Tax=Amycolatopsis endophytica TaxID=860233 RepID=A0A853B5K2_9PSEU|nr:hypothetical protein [Amycolatopsis endophytica]